MEEYFCPKCQAILNDQYGFDPSYGEWTCTNCGERLMDEAFWEGNVFTGVVWHCDQCNALLNNQYGFSDTFGTWVCSECGYVNGITEDDIIDDNDKIECPSCGGILNKQPNFSEYYNDWDCSFCGAKLTREYSTDDFIVKEDEEKIECPICRENLLKQSCFYGSEYEWTCESCGAKLTREYSTDDFIVKEDEEKIECPICGENLLEQIGFDNDCYEWTCESCDARLIRDYVEDDFCIKEQQSYYERNNAFYSDNETNYYNDDSNNYSKSDEINRSQAKDKKKRKLSKQAKYPRAELLKIRAKAVLLKKKKIEVSYNYSDFIDEDFSAVYNALYNRGFSNIKEIAIDDVCKGSEYDEGVVSGVTIKNNSYFSRKDLFEYDSQIIIEYHIKKKITIPFSSNSVYRNNYIEVVRYLYKLGFIEIYEKQITDLTKGWLIKDGAIERIEINGNDHFKKNEVYPFDSKIVIEYHTFKNR